MADVFFSYDRVDRPFVEQASSAIVRAGWTVWWDRELEPRAGRAFSDVLEHEIGESKCLVVFWSTCAARSVWVRAEADVAHKQGKLIQATIDGTEPPLPFNAYQYASLVDWDGLAMHGAFPDLMSAIEHFAPRAIFSLAEAENFIAVFAKLRKADFGEVEQAADSPFGTQAYRAPARDGMGVAYCHASGNLKGQVYYVRKGIAIMYEQILGGSCSPLGLPVSNEELIDGKGYPTTFFEGGYIEWSPKSWLATAVRLSAEGEEVLAEEKV